MTITKDMIKLDSIEICEDIVTMMMTAPDQVGTATLDGYTITDLEVAKFAADAPHEIIMEEKAEIEPEAAEAVLMRLYMTGWSPELYGDELDEFMNELQDYSDMEHLPDYE